MPPRRPPYPEDSYNLRITQMSVNHDETVVHSGSKCPYSDVSNDIQSVGRHSRSRSRLDYDVGSANSCYRRVSRLGQDSQLGYGTGSKTTRLIYSNDYLPGAIDVEGGRYSSGGYGRPSSASYY